MLDWLPPPALIPHFIQPLECYFISPYLYSPSSPFDIPLREAYISDVQRSAVGWGGTGRVARCGERKNAKAHKNNGLSVWLFYRGEVPRLRSGAPVHFVTYGNLKKIRSESTFLFEECSGKVEVARISQTAVLYVGMPVRRSLLARGQTELHCLETFFSHPLAPLPLFPSLSARPNLIPSLRLLLFFCPGAACFR